MFTNLKKNYLAYLVILGGLMGTYAAFSLLTNRIEYYKNPDFIPPCSINIWLDCGVVMKSKWASMFGFPNTIIGLITYPMAVLTGLFMMFNHQNSKVVMNFCMVLAGLGVITNLTLLYISAYIIASLCPWCLLAGVATSNIFFSILFYNIKNDYLIVPNQRRIKSLLNGGWDLIPVVIYYFAIFFFVYISFTLRENGVNTTKFFDPIFWLWDKN